MGAAPLFLTNGKGSHVWDVDGNEYIDFVNSLAAINIGYAYPEIDNAVRQQMESGVILSLPHVLECEVAEAMRGMIPCAEMTRFGKNGSDATSGAIRLARAYTNRDRVAVCGYHGWQDWYIGSTSRNRGVPKATSSLTHSFTYNDIESLSELFRKFPGEFAAVILEPMSAMEPVNDFLHKVKDLCQKNGSVLVFDETITGFRFSNGGAQQYFGVTPDLASFGKGMANGYPVSAVSGKAEIMHLMEEIFFSFTFGGELLSLAAASATMKLLRREPVLAHLASQGKTILAETRKIIEDSGVHTFLDIKGHPSWAFLLIKDHNGFSQMEIKTLFLQEMFRRGILVLNTFNMSYSHGDSEVNAMLKACREVFPILNDAVNEKKMAQHLLVPSLELLFKVR